jgi:glutathione synthase/RimK-type ligase-like ATP-grasp enzyme
MKRRPSARQTNVGYVLAGLDFVFDQDENPWFIEANTIPGAFFSYRKNYGNNRPLKELAKFMKRYSREPCVLTLYHKSTMYRKRDLWEYDILKQWLPNLHICYMEKNMGRRKKLIDKNGVEFEPTCMLVRSHDCEGISIHFEKRIPVINPRSVVKLAGNKFSALKAIKKYSPDINIPKTFLVKNNVEFKALLRKNSEIFGAGYVVKPVDDTCGHGVHVFSHNEKFRVRRPELLEQRIKPRLINRKYWDVRAFVVNGRFVGAIMRESRSRVTNISKGAKTYRVPKRLLNRLKKPSEDIIKAINTAAGR